MSQNDPFSDITADAAAACSMLALSVESSLAQIIEGVDPGLSRSEVFTMIYELRVYQPIPGQMPKLLARFRDKLSSHLGKAWHPSHRLLDDPCRGIQQRANLHTPVGVACRSRDEVDGIPE
jgi:hypothetical protein